jgi:hypothetical protein
MADMERTPKRFLRDAVLLGGDIRKGNPVSDDELGYLQGVMHQQWRSQWENIPNGEPVASRQNFCELLMPVMTADGTAVAGTTEGVLFPAAYTALPANFFDSPGKTVRFRAFGVMTTGATPGTLTLTPRYGTTTGGTTLGAGTVSGTLVASKTAVPWFIDATVICRAIGSSGSIAFFGIWECPQGYTTAPGSSKPARVPSRRSTRPPQRVASRSARPPRTRARR